LKKFIGIKYFLYINLNNNNYYYYFFNLIAFLIGNVWNNLHKLISKSIENRFYYIWLFNIFQCIVLNIYILTLFSQVIIKRKNTLIYIFIIYVIINIKYIYIYNS